jgi:hypothetical protein
MKKINVKMLNEFFNICGPDYIEINQDLNEEDVIIENKTKKSITNEKEEKVNRILNIYNKKNKIIYNHKNDSSIRIIEELRLSLLKEQSEYLRNSYKKRTGFDVYRILNKKKSIDNIKNINWKI